MTLMLNMTARRLTVGGGATWKPQHGAMVVDMYCKRGERARRPVLRERGEERWKYLCAARVEM